MNQPAQWAELEELVNAQCEGMLTDRQARRVEELVAGDAELRREYLLYLHLHAWAERYAERERTIVRASDLDGKAAPDGSTPVCQPASTSHVPVPLTFFGTALHGTVGCFSSGWPAAYLVATVIFGIGLLVGSFVPVSCPAPIAKRMSLPSGVDGGPKTETVGRITAMVDCRWDKRLEIKDEGSDDGFRPSSLIPHPSSLVSLGDKFRIASGLLEITYHTGAKVILQGPVTYEVESAAGGYLSLGKLSAKVEGQVNVKSEIENPKSETISKSPNLQISKFVVRTSVATVTDLGTEFGVDVGQDGTNQVHVFCGVVEVQPSGESGQRAARAVRLTENESAKVEKQPGGGKITVHRVAANPLAFVRVGQLPKLAEELKLRPLRRWQGYSQYLRTDPTLVAYYNFESAGKDNATLPNLSSAGKVLDGHVEGAEWVYGRLPGKFALYFHGPGSGDKVILPEAERFKFVGPFSVAVWFRVERFTAMSHTLVAKGVTSWQLQQDKRTKRISFDTSRDPHVAPWWDVTRASTRVDDGRWHLAVSVFNPIGDTAIRKVYIDGCLEVAAESPAHFRQNDEPVWLGADSELPGAEFYGLIDEAAIFSRMLSAGEVAAMFEVGSPDGKVVGRPEARKQKGGDRH